MTSGDGKRRRVLSPEERVLWTTVTRSIAPLRESADSDEKGPVTIDAARVVVSEATPGSRKPALTESRAPPLAPLGRRMKQRVARGKEKIDGRLDLHGLTQSEAHATLLRFLRTASSREARLVLVITGKGARAGEGEQGVLKRQVPQWLGSPEFRPLIVGFEDAHAAHGGEGALYVRVRRNKRS
jgi:DNA-nicking Smr family endonuclease